MKKSLGVTHDVGNTARMTDPLFPLPSPQAPRHRDEDVEPRVLRPNRRQLQLRAVDLDATLPPEHRARVIWAFVEGLDLRARYEAIRAIDGQAGRPAIDPAILMAVWLYATVEGVGSARGVARLCEEHDAYRWLCGGVSVNYHTLADFRVAHGDVLDQLLTDSVAALLAEGLVDLTRVAQDGVRVRAHAGGGSFRRAARLRAFLGAAEAQVRALRAELARDPGAASRREAAARERAAVERHQRIAEALRQLPALAARRKRASVKGPARRSTTDPDARVMKMADGGFRPAYNTQFVTATRGQIIVGVEVTNRGADQEHLTPLYDQLVRRFGRGPAEVLADGGYVDIEDIRAVAARGGRVYAPPPGAHDPTRPHRRVWRQDDAILAEWRGRMYTAAGQTVYRERASTSECVNALARSRGLRQFLVRGLAKVRTVALWFALAHNALRAVSLRGSMAPA